MGPAESHGPDMRRCRSRRPWGLCVPSDAAGSTPASATSPERGAKKGEGKAVKLHTARQWLGIKFPQPEIAERIPKARALLRKSRRAERMNRRNGRG